MARNSQNCSIRKMTSSTDTVFGLRVCQNWIYQPEIWYARFPDMVPKHIFRLFENFENFGLKQKI